jgi:hypothetical protein
MHKRITRTTARLTDLEASRLYDLIGAAIGRDTDTRDERLPRFGILIDGWLAGGDKHGAGLALRSAYHELADALGRSGVRA